MEAKDGCYTSYHLQDGAPSQRKNYSTANVLALRLRSPNSNAPTDSRGAGALDLRSQAGDGNESSRTRRRG